MLQSNSINDPSLLQIDLNSLYNHLSFSIKMCVVLHFKANNSTINVTSYLINDIELYVSNVTEHRDLGIVFLTISFDLPILNQS